MRPMSSFISIFLLIFMISESLSTGSIYRLPNNTVPRLYTINLEAHIDDAEFTFDGTSSTLFEVLIPTQNVTVHAAELIVIDKTYTRVICDNGTILQPISQKWNSTLQFFSLEFDRILDIGNYSIKFKWRGYDPSDFQGFYQAHYNTTDEDQNEITVYLAASEFQATGARSAFPCWDEPGLKAQFDVSLKHYTNFTALSNMPVKNVLTAENGKVWTSFNRSPLMSTYFVAFVIAPYVQYVNDYGNITMWAPKPKFEAAHFPFNMSLRIIVAMEEYTGIPYSLPKMDQAMIPQYPSGAVEHWGLISYGPGILFQAGFDDINTNIMAALLAAHEIAHQWFGNLVTTQWWDDLWLNEAFADYFQYKILDEISDNWNAINLFDTKTRNQAAFPSGEEGEKVYPIKWMPETPEEIDTMFSSVTYVKGAGVVEMLEHILTEKVFRNGIRKYLDRHQYGSVVTDDLWRALQETYSEEGQAPDLNIKEIMEPWIEQTGYPLVNVTRDYGKGTATITQMNVRTSEPENSWMIPINYATSSNPNFTSTRPTHWLPRSNESLIITDINKDDWIILNMQNKGFYRVNYDEENWKRLANHLNSDNYQKIHIINRAQLLHDIIYLAQREPLRYFDLAIDMASYLHRETNYLPWTAVSLMFDEHPVYFMNTPHYEVISKWILHLMNNMIDRVGFDDDGSSDYLSALARNDLLGWACTFGHKGCRTAATAKLVEILSTKSKNSFPPYRRDRIYCPGLIEANETIWDLMMNVHFANPEEPGYEYLGCTNNHTLMEKYLNLLLNYNETAYENDLPSAFQSLTEHTQENIDFALDFLIENHERLENYFREDNSTDKKNSMKGIVQKLGAAITTDNQIEKFNKFLNKQKSRGKMSDYHHDAIKDTEGDFKTISKRISELINSFLEKNH